MCTSTVGVSALRVFKNMNCGEESIDSSIIQVLDAVRIRHSRARSSSIGGEASVGRHDEELSEAELLRKTMPELKEILRERALPVSGNKSTLISRILDIRDIQDRTDIDIAAILLKKLFLKPVSSSAMKIGSANEENVCLSLCSSWQF